MNFSKQHHNEDSPAPQRCKSFSFDVNQQAQSLGEWEQHYDQHSGGVFNGYLDELKLNGIHFFEEFTNRTLQQQCCIKDNNLWFGFSLQKQRPKLNNQEIAIGQLMRRPSGVEFELITPADFQIYGLVLDKEKIGSEMIGLDAELWHNQSATLQLSQPNNYVSYELAKLINLLLNNNSMPNSPLNLLAQGNQSRLSKLMPLIRSKVADLLAQTEYPSEQKLATTQTKQRVITDISNYIKQTKRYPLTITELCQISHVSRRALQYSFEQGLGVSPIQYIRDCRLNEIRRILLNMETDITITDLALNYGFFHLGTFNNQYKQLFAETPTQTMQRATHYQQNTIKVR